MNGVWMKAMFTALLTMAALVPSMATAQQATRYFARQKLAMDAPPKPTSNRFENTEWIWCTDRYQSCVVPIAAQVRFGPESGPFLTRDVAAGTRITCWTDYFGGDPAPDVFKQCWYRQDFSVEIPSFQGTRPTGDKPATTEDEIARNIEMIRYIGVTAPKLSAIYPRENRDIGGWFGGEVTSVAWNPDGGKFSRYSREPYATIYIRSHPHEPFCLAWAAASRPANMGPCDDWYGSHIVVYVK